MIDPLTPAWRIVGTAQTCRASNPEGTQTSFQDMLDWENLEKKMHPKSSGKSPQSDPNNVYAYISEGNDIQAIIYKDGSVCSDDRFPLPRDLTNYGDGLSLAKRRGEQMAQYSGETLTVLGMPKEADHLAKNAYLRALIEANLHRTLLEDKLQEMFCG
jgi:hypothetical protein